VACCQKCSDPQPCGGDVLLCLHKQVEQFLSEDSKKDDIAFEMKEAHNHKLNQALQTACQYEIKKLYPKAKDYSKVLNCLKKNCYQLKETCKK
jgi:hypothetical protein